MWFVTAAAAAPDLLAPHRSGQSSPQDVAVIVGIDDYGFLPDVVDAVRDAEAVRGLMTGTLGLSPDRVRVLSAANREQMLAAAEAAASSVGPGGRVWWWFSGHGATSPIDGSLLMVGDDAKAQPDAFAARAVSVAELRDRLPGGSVVVVDACAAGRDRGGEELVPGVRFAVPTWTRQPGLTVWTAASATELAEAWPAVGHGLFTYLAVGALRGWADGATGAADGAVDLAEAQEWVRRTIVQVGGSQHPELHGAGPVVVSGALEVAPAPDALPPLHGRPVVVPASGFRPPFTFGRGVYADADGRSLSRDALVALAPDDAGVVRAQRGKGTGRALTALGVVVLGGSAVGLTVSGLVQAERRTEWSEDSAAYDACLASEPPSTTGVGVGGWFCTAPGAEPAPLGAALAPWVVGGGAGAALTVSGVFLGGAHHRRLAAAVTEAVDR